MSSLKKQVLNVVSILAKIKTYFVEWGSKIKDPIFQPLLEKHALDKMYITSKNGHIISVNLIIGKVKLSVQNFITRGRYPKGQLIFCFSNLSGIPSQGD